LVGYGDNGWVAAGGTVCSDDPGSDGNADRIAGGGGLSEGMDWGEGVTGISGCYWQKCLCGDVEADCGGVGTEAEGDADLRILQSG
jgi:hypothetical protein